MLIAEVDRRFGFRADAVREPLDLEHLLELLAAALLAGLAAAWSFGALDLTIRYKLIPQQLW